MCVVSNIGDIFTKTLPEKYPEYVPNTQTIPSAPVQYEDPEVRRQLAELRKEMQEIRDLLKAAKKYDEATGQKNCEMEDKIELLKHFARLVDVDLEEVFGTRSSK
jgi:hypothetical protein